MTLCPYRVGIICYGRSVTVSEPQRALGGNRNPLATVVGPFTKAGSYYARSWGAYLGGARSELPLARPTLPPTP